MFGRLLLKSLAVAAAALWAGASFAAPVPFVFDFSTTPSGFTITGESVDNSANCPFGGKPCSHVNDNDTILITHATALFDILSAAFSFNGKGNGNGILFEGLLGGSVVGSASFLLGASSGFGDGSLSIGTVPIVNKVDYLALFNSNFSGIDTLRITSSKDGNKSANVRVDNIAGSVPSAVPVPAAGLLLLGGLGGLAALRRRRSV